MVNKLEFLKNSGRISSIDAFASTMTLIKPVLSIVGGKIK